MGNKFHLKVVNKETRAIHEEAEINVDSEYLRLNKGVEGIEISQDPPRTRWASVVTSVLHRSQMKYPTKLNGAVGYPYSVGDVIFISPIMVEDPATRKKVRTKFHVTATVTEVTL